MKKHLDVLLVDLAIAGKIKQPDLQFLDNGLEREERNNGASCEHQLERVHVRLAPVNDGTGIIAQAEAVEDDANEIKVTRVGREVGAGGVGAAVAGRRKVHHFPAEARTELE